MRKKRGYCRWIRVLRGVWERNRRRVKDASRGSREGGCGGRKGGRGCWMLGRW